MNSEKITDAAALLDNLGSGTLEQGDFYLFMVEAGNISADLCMIAMNEARSMSNDMASTMMNAAECLKDICIAQNPERLDRALRDAQKHARELYAIIEGERHGRA